MNIKISASILAADIMNLESEIEKLNNSNIDGIHVDIMDGHFVPNIALGFDLVKTIKKYTQLPVDVHLMVMNPEKYLDILIDSGADIVTIHYESTNQLGKILQKLKKSNIKTGVSLLPTTNESVIKYIISLIDIILVMTVNPGFCNQKFLSTQIEKIKNIANIAKEKSSSLDIAVDGGINNVTAPLVKKAGATWLVVGSYLYSQELNKSITSLK